MRWVQGLSGRPGAGALVQQVMQVTLLMPAALTLRRAGRLLGNLLAVLPA